MKLIVKRNSQDDKQTLGKLRLVDDNGKTIGSWHSLELPYIDNKRRISCIPKGQYIAHKHNSPKFGQCLWIKDVPNRSEILIHRGNYHFQILGCILIGRGLSDINTDGYKDVTSSRKAVQELLDKIGNQAKIRLEIR